MGEVGSLTEFLQDLVLSTIKGILPGGETSEPMEMQQNHNIGPNFWSCIMNVSCNISATTRPILYFDGVLEPPDP